jgi:hypothetical protein
MPSPLPPPLTFAAGPAFAVGFPCPGARDKGKAGEAPRAGRHSATGRGWCSRAAVT